MRFYIESNGDCYVAAWKKIPNIEGTGETPHAAINNLRGKLKKALSESTLLERIGHNIVETVLDEMKEWEGQPE